MTQRIRLFALLGICLLAAIPVFADGDVTLEGAFVWEREDGNHEGDLKAILTPTGDGEWSVAFHFDWEDGKHVYTGTCSGSLEGTLSGDVVADGGREMKFKFSGSFENGTFSGAHAFIDKEGQTRNSGTLTLESSEG